MSTQPRDTVQQAARHVTTEAARAATRSVSFVSPFLSSAVADQFADLARRSSANWRLLTNLDPRAIAAGVLQTSGLRTLMDHGVEIRTIRRLHAKVVLCDDTFGFVGSGNLTNAGLDGPPSGNLELGVLLDPEQQARATAIVEAWWNKARPVDTDALDAAEAAARAIPVHDSLVGDLADVTGTRSDIATRLLARARLHTLWAKAVYGDGSTSDGRPRTFISSSKAGRPTFAPGDLVLIYAKDLRACPTIVEVTSESRFDPDFVEAAGYPRANAERWPWVNDVTELLAVGPDDAVPSESIGFTGQALQNGHKKLDLAQFAAAVQYLAGRRDHL